MISINEAKRLIKRAILSNIVSDKPNLAITPLISGKHGIGKSAMIKSIAKELGGVCITIEGGTLKEGEITGLPYQYKNDDGKVGIDPVQSRKDDEVRNLVDRRVEHQRGNNQREEDLSTREVQLGERVRRKRRNKYVEEGTHRGNKHGVKNVTRERNPRVTHKREQVTEV